MATITTLVSFNSSNGAYPDFTTLVADAAGNLFGTTVQGGATGYGTVFELVKTASGFTAITPLASFSSSNGAYPYGGVIMDAAGNLSGTTYGGGANGVGTVFELFKTANGYAAPTTLASFNSANGAYPLAGLLMDSAGDLFGTTQQGGAGSNGTVFELVKTANGYAAPTTLANFNSANGDSPFAGLIMDSAGDLFGTTEAGGASGYGTVFELVKSASGYAAPTTLASFDYPNGAYPFGGLIMDSAGNLFGTTSQGGASGRGTVFELVRTANGYAAPTTLASFDYPNAAQPLGGIIMDSAGDLFGTTQQGGATGAGTVFELVKTANGYAAPTILASFNFANGASPETTLIADSAGDLFGTTAEGGAGRYGTVFEIANTGFFITDVIAPDAPAGLADAAITGGYVNAANDTSAQALTGSAEAGSAVTVYDGATRLGITTSDASTGLWSYTLGALADGGHSMTATATDAAGNVSAPSAVLAFTVDTAFPIAPTVADASISLGYVNAAHDTAAQALTGTAEAGSTVKIYLNGGAIPAYAVTADTSGNWSQTIGALADGAYSYTATATDAAGNVSAVSSPRAFTVDTLAPTISLDAIGGTTNQASQSIGGLAELGAAVQVSGGQGVINANGSWTTMVTLTEGVNHITATATDLAGNTATSNAVDFVLDTIAPLVSIGSPGGLTNHAAQTIAGVAEAGLTVQIFEGASQIGQATAAGDGSWHASVTLANEGVNAIIASASDAATNTSYSNTVVYTLDTVAPIISITSPGGATNQPVQTITGVTEPGAGTIVQLYDGAVPIAQATASGDGHWLASVTLANQGANLITATTTDAAGNLGTSAGVTYTLDTAPPTAPTIADLSIANGYVNAARDTATQALTGTAAAGSTVKIYLNGGSTPAYSLTADVNGNWSQTIGALADGAYSYTATATDAAGNVSAVSSPLAFTVDTLAPTISLDAVGGTTNQASQSIGGLAESGAAVQVSGGQGVVNANGSWTTMITLAEGVNHITATATDLAGNTATSNVVDFVLDTIAPSVSIGSPGGLTNHAAQTIAGVAEAGLTVQIFEGASQIGQATAAGDGSWHASVTLANEGVNAIIASASDAATNTSYSNTVVYTLDTVAPIISITSPGGTTNQPVQTITGVTEPGVGVIVQLYDGAVPIAQATASGDGHWSASVTLNQGANVLTATTMDAAGNTGASNAITYTVSTATPTVTSIAATPTTGDLAAGASVKFTIGVSQAVTVSGVPQISLNDGGAALYSASLSTPTSLVFVYTVAPGQQSADLRSTALALPSGASIMDAYGNALAGSVAFDTRLQVDAPAVTGVAVATNPSGLLALRAGQTVTLTVSLSEAVTVTGKPQLVLNDGGVAKYLSGSGTNALTFSYQVASGQNVADLVVSSFNLNGGSIKAAPGSAHNVADLSGAVGTDTHLQIDTLAPVVLSEATNPGSGDLAAGATIAITVTMSEAVIVTGAPTLKLNDGGVASFDAARSTARALAFNYIVKPGDNTPDLAITAMTLNGGAVQDIAGNAATLSGAAINPAGVLQIDTKTPTVTSVTTNPASGSLGAGKLVKLTVNMSEAVTVNGAPVLQLNVGETATYDAGLSSSTALVFDYTVKAGDNTPDLKVSGVSLNGGGVQDLASNAANLAGAVANPAGVLAIDTTPPISLLKTVGTGTSPVLGGTTEASSALSLSYVDLATGSAGQLGTTTADGSGGWSLATNGGWYHSADGVEVKISATDTAGNVGVTNTFWGTTGADTFASTASADYFVGNGASDTFVFSNGMAGGAGQDVIKDFGAHLVKAKAQADVVEFDNVFSSFASLFASAHNNAAGAAEIDYMSGGVASSLTLLGVSASQLTASDFKLVNG